MAFPRAFPKSDYVSNYEVSYGSTALIPLSRSGLAQITRSVSFDGRCVCQCQRNELYPDTRSFLRDGVHAPSSRLPLLFAENGSV